MPVGQQALIVWGRTAAQGVGYFAGVGTDPLLRLPGGGIGPGLSRNVRQAYRFIRDNWEPGDELFIF